MSDSERQVAITMGTPERANRFNPVQALLGAFIAVLALAACAIGLSFVFTDPMDEDPPRVEAEVVAGATAEDVFATLEGSQVSRSGVEKIELDMVDRRVVIHLTSPSRTRPVRDAEETHVARRDLLRLLREPDSPIRVTRINWKSA